MNIHAGQKKRFRQSPFFILLLLALIPCAEQTIPSFPLLSQALRSVLIFSLLGLGLTVVTGFSGLLMLGGAGFMAIGVYTFAITTTPLYPFQIGFWWGILAALITGGASGLFLGIPAVRLRGDYLAIVTLGFGEILQDILRNLEIITKGTQGINPLVTPTLFSVTLSSSTPYLWYYLLLSFLFIAFVIIQNIEHSGYGRMWRAIRDDELAARSLGIPVRVMKLIALIIGACLCSLAGALLASSLNSSGEPGNYDFNISIIALCVVIVGGIGSLRGVLIGAIVMIGCNSILLVKLSEYLTSLLGAPQNVFASPTTWKYMLFGLALIITMRFSPHGIVGKEHNS